MDLTQAEAVIDLIRAQTDLAFARRRNNSKAGSVKRSRKLREDLISLIANLEAYIDFPEEGHRA